MGEYRLAQEALTTGLDRSRPPAVAAVGCGYWGRNLVRNFAELGALAAICDPNRGAALELAERHQTPCRRLRNGTARSRN